MSFHDICFKKWQRFFCAILVDIKGVFICVYSRLVNVGVTRISVYILLVRGSIPAYD